MTSFQSLKTHRKPEAERTKKTNQQKTGFLFIGFVPSITMATTKSREGFTGSETEREHTWVTTMKPETREEPGAKKIIIIIQDTHPEDTQWVFWFPLSHCNVQLRCSPLQKLLYHSICIFCSILWVRTYIPTTQNSLVPVGGVRRETEREVGPLLEHRFMWWLYCF